jgi:DNA replication and repair protein RecF
MVRFGQDATRVEVEVEGRDGGHALSVGFQPGEPKRIRVDGVAVEGLGEHPSRPLVSVFLPDRLELIKGPPSLRRAHIDQVVAALWPARTATRRGYSQALAQRNALLGRIRAGHVGRDALGTWDAELARQGIALRDDRAAAVGAVAPAAGTIADDLGLAGDVELRYRPRSKATGADELAAELAERRDADPRARLHDARPHRDDLAPGPRRA